MNPSTQQEISQETSMDFDMIHQLLNHGIAAYCLQLGLPGIPPSIEKETIRWFLTVCTPYELMHLLTIITSVYARDEPTNACARYALDRADGAAFQSMECAIFDVLLDGLQERGNEPAEIASMLEAITKPLEHLLDMARVSAAPCPTCATVRLHAMHGETADHTEDIPF